ncbi:uncharacterized protein EI90DRAFT_1747288 [Cantharellus anzutake]|uniref:uncharacterized protein n=1 Tax=Cantharellus anzutake TaxID=1750568 RepID=UPI0019066EF3|nr:uncharacterized protein EI90DRAFT_1747288 [Cantharellus anzutake]KAF8341522.1 hypothetical protein EI90DRAFT_1747288 [Cantharellus anzutake]
MRLPAHAGCKVGVTTFSQVAKTPRKWLAPMLPNGDPALQLEEICYNVFYPCREPQPTSQRRLPWLVRPLQDFLHGFTKFTGVSKWFIWPFVYLYGRFLPYCPDAPLLDPVVHAYGARKTIEGTSKWPLVIFSHGLFGSRTTYSQFCGRLASEGKNCIDSS